VERAVGGIGLAMTSPPPPLDAALAAAWVGWIDAQAEVRVMLPARLGPAESADVLAERIAGRAREWAHWLSVGRGLGQLDVAVAPNGERPSTNLGTGAGARWLAARRPKYAVEFVAEELAERWATDRDVVDILPGGPGRLAVLARRGSEVRERLIVAAGVQRVSGWTAIWSPFWTSGVGAKTHTHPRS
jgi:hypothetical protein